jgi:hypothetical protein
MVLTWTFYPKLGEKVSLKVTYKPELDKFDIWGFLLVETNEAYVSWDCFKAFDRAGAIEKREAFQRLQRIETSKMNMGGLNRIDIPLSRPVEIRNPTEFLPRPNHRIACLTLRRHSSIPEQWELDGIH